MTLDEVTLQGRIYVYIRRWSKRGECQFLKSFLRLLKQKFNLQALQW